MRYLSAIFLIILITGSTAVSLKHKMLTK